MVQFFFVIGLCTFGIGTILLAYAYHWLRNGAVVSKGLLLTLVFTRAKNPILFGLNIGCAGLVGFSLLVAGFWLVLDLMATG